MPAEKRREQLLDAAGTLFMQKGYGETTTDEIARKAGLTKGALYFHFKSKEDLLFELVKQMYDDLFKSTEAIPEGTATPEQMLKMLLKAKPKVLQANFVSYLDFWIQASRIPRIDEHLRKGVDEFEGLFADRLDHRFGRTRQERRQIAVFIMAMFDGLTVRHMLGSRGVNFKRQLKLISEMTQCYEANTPKSSSK